MSRHLDVKGYQCPIPILRTRRLLDSMEAGEDVVVEATDPASVIDFRHFADVTDHHLLSWEERDGVFIYHLRKASQSPDETA